MIYEDAVRIVMMIVKPLHKGGSLTEDFEYSDDDDDHDDHHHSNDDHQQNYYHNMRPVHKGGFKI